jgi:hypothetical protein
MQNSEIFVELKLRLGQGTCAELHLVGLSMQEAVMFNMVFPNKEILPNSQCADTPNRLSSFPE